MSGERDMFDLDLFDQEAEESAPGQLISDMPEIKTFCRVCREPMISFVEARHRICGNCKALNKLRRIKKGKK